MGEGETVMSHVGANQDKVSVNELFKAYRERRSQRRSPRDCVHDSRCLVLNGVTFSVKKGSLTCFLGPSGCGKSTLLRIIAGFETPDSGEVMIDGRPVYGPSSRHIFLFQEDGLFPWMTAYENVMLGIRDLEDKEQRHEKVLEYLDMVGLSGFEGHFPHQLSGGMRRRAEVARALITNPEVLFMDEPFSALDFMTRLQMREEMINVHAMFDSTILFITHDIDEALQLGDQIIILGDRPSVVKGDILVSHPHPRDLGVGELAKLRKEIYFLMGLHTAL